MSIAWEAFTPGAALAGGALIGLAASLLLVANGRVAGISGILSGLFRRDDRAWRWAFVAGLLGAPLVLGLVSPGVGHPAAVSPIAAGDMLRLLLAGLLVGFGTRLANGCTSGHGVCGLARLSVRSLAAVLVFMGAAFAVVFLLRHVLPGSGA